MKANRDSRFLALNRQLFYLVAYHQRKKFLLRSSNVEAVADKSVLGLTFCMLSGAELEGKRGDLRPGAEASLASQSAEQGRCWPPWGLLAWRMPVIFRPWKGSQDIVFAGNRLSALGLPASCQPYAVFFLWHPNMNVWIFAWLMRSYIRKASVGNIYKQANFLNENVLCIFFLRKKNWSPVHSEVLFTLTPLLSSEKN